MATSVLKQRSESERAITTVAICILAGCLGILLFAGQASSLTQFISILGVGLLIAGACMLSGALLGFLFGIPRTLQQDKLENASSDERSTKQSSDNSVSYQVNTNLEQISDWLTKILVGVGLTQITALPEAVNNYAEFVSSGLGSSAASKTFAVAVLFFYSVCGFLISYLWTRLYLAGALRQADLAAVGQKIADVENKVSELEKQAGIDAGALSIVQRQLNPGPGSPPIPQEEINSAVLPASASIKDQIYYLAHDVRSQNWREREKKPVMERTIPVFRALVASDIEDVNHFFHGQLGFALKDQRKPDWAKADEELTKAIELRGPWQTEGWLLYEFARGICRINLEEAFRQEKESGAEEKNEILADLKSAANSPDLNVLIAQEPTIQKWLSLNKIKWSK